MMTKLTLKNYKEGEESRIMNNSYRSDNPKFTAGAIADVPRA